MKRILRDLTIAYLVTVLAGVTFPVIFPVPTFTPTTPPAVLLYVQR